MSRAKDAKNAKERGDVEVLTGNHPVNPVGPVLKIPDGIFENSEGFTLGQKRGHPMAKVKQGSWHNATLSLPVSSLACLAFQRGNTLQRF